ncbi:MAG: hypothetical protein RIS33_1188 [Actinomycetota bacterium]
MLRRDIEGLRALAVGLVVLYHAHFLGLAGGFIGVDVFFVISGFLITNLLLREHDNSGTISIGNFYARRARRLLPASALVIVLTAIASWVWLEPLRLKNLGSDSIAAAGFVSNMVFAGRNTDYLQAGIPPSPLQHFWSLSVEEQFYVIWPTLLLVLLWRAGRSRTRATLAITAISIASFALCVWQTEASQPWAFFGLHTRAWELGVGALLAIAWPWVRVVAGDVRNALAWLGIAAVVFAAFWLDETMAFPGWLAAIPVLGTAAALIGGDDSRWGPSIVLRHPVAQWIGARSYSIYLWHWPALIIGEAWAGRPLNVLERLGLIAVSLVGASLSYRWVENPIRHSERLQARPVLALSLGAVLIASGVGTGLVVRSTDVELSTDVVAETPTLVATTTTVVAGTPESTTTTIVTVPDGPPPAIANATSPLEALYAAVDTAEVPSNLEPSIGGAAGDKPVIYDNDCHVDFGATRPNLCEYGDSSSDFTVALFGDSHAAQWFPILESIADDNGWRLLPLSKSGCPPIDEITYNSLVGPTYPACRPWRENVFALMAEQDVDVVFVAASNRLLDPDTKQPFADSVWSTGYDALIARLASIGVVPVLITDTPYPGQDVPVCLSKAVRDVSSCVASREKAVRASRQQTVIDSAVRNGVQYLDVINWLCTETACPVIVGNLLVYRDSNHVTTAYAEWLKPVFAAAIEPYVNGVRSRISTS